MHLSCYYGHTTVAKLLIKSKASIKQVAGRKQTFLHKAIISADAEFVNVLISTTLEEHGPKGQYLCDVRKIIGFLCPTLFCISNLVCPPNLAIIIPPPGTSVRTSFKYGPQGCVRAPAP